MLDFAVDNRAFDPPVYEARLFKREQVILAVPHDFQINEAAARFRLTTGDLSRGEGPRAPLALFRELPFLMLKEGNDARERAENLCAQAGFSPRIRLQLGQQLAAYTLAGHGLGASFISDTLAVSAPPDERMYFYRIDSPDVERRIRLFYKRTRVFSAPMRAFL